jgi:cytochrome P450
MPAAVQTVGWWTRPIPMMERARARYGNRWTLRLLATPPFVMLSDPDQIKQVFTAPAEVLHPGEGARILEPVVGKRSILLLDEAEHLQQRRLMLGAFHRERMEGLSDLVQEVTDRELAGWPRDEPVELHPRLQALTLEVILRAVFGLDSGPRLEALRDNLTAVLEWGSGPMGLLPPLQRDWGGRGPWMRFVELRDRTDELIFEQIADRRTAADEGDDVLAMLLAARDEDGTPMTDRELRDELMTLLVAGHETTASQLAWAFERLAREPAVTATLAAEIDSGDGDAYVTATIREALRRRPVLPNVAPRLVKEPITVGDWDYEPGTCLVCNAYLIHHDPEIYPDPYSFRPERFLDNEPGTYTWIPFGGGRRRCLGAGFAQLEMKAVLTAAFAGSRVLPAGEARETTRRRAITLSPRLGARTVLAPRRERVATPA